MWTFICVIVVTCVSSVVVRAIVKPDIYIVMVSGKPVDRKVIPSLTGHQIVIHENRV